MSHSKPEAPGPPGPSNSIELLSPLFARIAPGATVRELTPLEGGVSSSMTRVDLEGQGALPSRLIVRRMGEPTRAHDPGSLRREHAVLTRVREAGVPTPRVLFADLEGELLGEPLLVLEYLEGEVAVAVPDPAAFAREVADAMAAIHGIDARGWGLPDPRGLSAPEPVPGRPVLAAAYRALAPHFSATPRSPTLLHGDFWPGNMLVREGRLVGVLDWEEARLGDPLLDIAVTRLDLLWVYGEATVEAFTARVAERRSISERELALADLNAALRPGAHLALWAEAYPKIGRPDVTVAAMIEAQDHFAERALARL